MAVLVVIEIPGGSSDLDEALIEAWNLTGNPPSGNRLRMAGPMDGGWRVISLWDSAEQFHGFLGNRLHVTLGGAEGEQPRVSVWEIETVHKFE
jgi:hypothetical protein